MPASEDTESSRSPKFVDGLISTWPVPSFIPPILGRKHLRDMRVEMLVECN
jgi:hypothetical protein